jgi:pimeloyl-ACP methyl ester carboxylesterase
VHVLLVHGLAGSSRWWRDVRPLLAERHDVEAVDLRRGDPVESLRRRANGSVLVGHSLGAYVCTRVALDHPERTRALALVAPVGVPLGRSVTANVTPLVRAVLHAPTRVLPALAVEAVRTGPLPILRGAATALGADVREELASLRLPTLLVWGSRDPLVPPELAEEWRAGIAHARVETIAGASHAPMLERPRELVDVLLRFLDELEHDST